MTSFVLGTASGFMLGVTAVDLHHDLYLLGDNMVDIVRTLELAHTGRFGHPVDLDTISAYYKRITHSDTSRALVIAMGVTLLITGKRLLAKV